MIVFLLALLLSVVMYAEKIFFFRSEVIYSNYIWAQLNLLIIGLLIIISLVDFILNKNINTITQPKTKKFSTKWQKTLGGVILFVIISSFFINFTKRSLEWDAVALYDARAKFMLEGVKYSDMNLFSKFDEIDYYYLLYPPYTSIAHYFWYTAHIPLPVSVFYSLYLLIFAVLLYEIAKKILGARMGLILVVLTVANINIYTLSLIEYTNLPFTVAITLGFFLIVNYLREKKLWSILLGIVLISTTQWIRFSEPVWMIFLASLGLIALRDIIKNKFIFNKILQWGVVVGLFTITCLVEYISWSYFMKISNNPSPVSLNPSIFKDLIMGFLNGKLFIVTYNFVNWLAVFCMIYLTTLYLGMRLWKHVGGNLALLYTYIVFAICLPFYFLLIYVSSFFGDWWESLGHSIIRSSSFIIPIGIFLLLYLYKETFNKIQRSNVKSYEKLSSAESNFFKEKIIFYIFIFLWGFALFLAFAESFFYPGVVIKFFSFNPLYIYAVLFLLGLGISFSRISKESTEYSILKKFNWILLCVFGLLLSLFIILGIVNYPNYVFSVFHIHTKAFINVFVIILFTHLVLSRFNSIDKPSRFIKHSYLKLTGKYSKIFPIALISIIFVLWILAKNLVGIEKILNKNLPFMLNNPQATYEEKMGEKIGNDFVNYTKFIKENTPENATILLPPFPAYPWPQTGNIPYMRYFLYPRKLLNGNEYEPAHNYSDENIDYVLITWGETETTSGNYTHGWPKFNVNAKKYIYYLNGEETQEVMGNYNYQDYKDKKMWGLIEVKK